MTQFGGLYSQYYDLLYRDKDYAGEIEYITKLLQRHGGKVTSILDLGCGTGRHAELLVEKGFCVHGVDQSHEMLEIAETRRVGKEDRLRFTQSNIHELNLESKFDAVISLFHVMSYQNTNSDVRKTLESVKRHLKSGGIFIFDFWYGPGVLTDLPHTRIKRLEDNELKVTRLAEPLLQLQSNLVDVNYEILIENKLTGEFHKGYEKHSMRYFFDPELELFCNEIGFEVVKKYGWLQEENSKLNTWYVVWIVKN